MKKVCTSFFIISIFCLTACGPKQQRADCENFKKGKFTIKSHFDDSYSIIDRNDSTQTEINSKSGQIVTARIKWTGSCDYELYYLTQTRNSDDTILSLIQSKPLKTKIIKVAKDYYVFESSMNNVDIKYVDTLRVFKK